MGTRYTIRRTGGATSPGYGQMVTPSAPKPGTTYYNPKTGNIETVSPASNQIRQPNYTRGVANYQTSPRLRGLQGCVKNAMSGQTFDGRKEAMKALNDTSKQCKHLLDTQEIPGGIPEQIQTTFNHP